jgi:plasmid stabilization system protein ParE
MARIGWTLRSLEDIREMVRGNYRVIYRATEELVEIIRVYHGARLFNERDLS